MAIALLLRSRIRIFFYAIIGAAALTAVGTHSAFYFLSSYAGSDILFSIIHAISNRSRGWNFISSFLGLSAAWILSVFAVVAILI
jgi:hypothetical protein